MAVRGWETQEERLAKGLLARKVSRRWLLAPLGARGSSRSLQEASRRPVAGGAASMSEPAGLVRCGSCGQHHGPSGEGCPTEAHQQALARGFRKAHKTAGPGVDSGTNTQEGGR
jgi:hypothetical protein